MCAYDVARIVYDQAGTAKPDPMNRRGCCGKQASHSVIGDKNYLLASQARGNRVIFRVRALRPPASAENEKEWADGEGGNFLRRDPASGDQSPQFPEVLLADSGISGAGARLRRTYRGSDGNEAAHPRAVAPRPGMHLLLGKLHSL